ncbi:MAG: SUMF1/EgtB/PvdO family nonheme iron enzyme, partial [Bacteroidota bacterium]
MIYLKVVLFTLLFVFGSLGKSVAQSAAAIIKVKKGQIRSGPIVQNLESLKRNRSPLVWLEVETRNKSRKIRPIEAKYVYNQGGHHTFEVYWRGSRAILREGVVEIKVYGFSPKNPGYRESSSLIDLVPPKNCEIKFVRGKKENNRFNIEQTLASERLKDAYLNEISEIQMQVDQGNMSNAQKRELKYTTGQIRSKKLRRLKDYGYDFYFPEIMSALSRLENSLSSPENNSIQSDPNPSLTQPPNNPSPKTTDYTIIGSFEALKRNINRVIARITSNGVSDSDKDKYRSYLVEFNRLNKKVENQDQYLSEVESVKDKLNQLNSLILGGKYASSPKTTLPDPGTKNNSTISKPPNKNLPTKKSSPKPENKEQKQQIKKLKTQLAKVENTYDSLSSQNSFLKKEFTKMRREKYQLEGEKSRLESEMISLQSGNKRQAGQIRQLRMSMAAMLQVVQSFIEKPKEISIPIGDKFNMELIGVPSADFLMGMTQGRYDTLLNKAPEIMIHNEHEVINNRLQHIDQVFFIAKYELTHEEYAELVPTHRFIPRDAKKPISNISFKDFERFIERLNQETGLRFDIPTEKEWEYAAVGPSGTTYPWGENCDGSRANVNSNQVLPVDYFAESDSWCGAYNM